MQVLQAGQHKLIYLELQPQMVAKIARDAGFETRAKDGQRHIQLDLSAPARAGPATALRRCRSGQSGLVLALPVLCGRADRDRHADAADAR